MSASDRRARGVLRRRLVTSTHEVYIGKESNRLEDAEVGLIHDIMDVIEVFVDSRRGPWERLVRPVLQDIPARWLADKTGLSRRTIQRLRNGHSQPRREHQMRLTGAALEYIGEHAWTQDTDFPLGDLAGLQTYLQEREETRNPN